MTQKFLFKPLDKFIINQYFAENRACTNGKKIITCDGFNPPSGYKSVYTNMTGHNGIDFYAPTLTPIYSSQDGIVEELVAEPSRGLGLGIITERKFYCDETGKEEYFKIRYWHNHSHYVKLGDKVKVGQLIALADNTGISSGSHLHFELKPVEVKFKKDGSIKSVKNIFQSNGYYGAINPLPYFLNENASMFNKALTIQDKVVILLLKWLKNDRSKK